MKKNCTICKFAEYDSYGFKCKELEKYICSDSDYHGFFVYAPEEFFCPSYKRDTKKIKKDRK